MEGHGIQNDVVDLIQPNDQPLRVVAIGKDVDFARYLVGPEYSGFTVWVRRSLPATAIDSPLVHPKTHPRR
jgi:hypothetical protein